VAKPTKEREEKRKEKREEEKTKLMKNTIYRVLYSLASHWCYLIRVDQ